MSAIPRITLAESQPEPESFSIGGVAAGGAAKFPIGGAPAEEEEALRAKALDTAAQAKTLVIRDAAAFAKAGEWLLTVKSLSKEIEDWFRPLVEAAHTAHKRLTLARSEKLAPLVEAEGYLKKGMAAYQEIEERKRREEERRLQEEARRRAEEEQLQAAIAAEQAGDKGAAEEIFAAPVEAPVVIVKPAATVAGVSFRENWKASVTDLKALARGVADGTVPPMAIMPNTAWLDGQARAMKGQLSYPGVKAYSEKVVSAGRG